MMTSLQHWQGKDVTVIVGDNFRECAQGVIGIFEDFKG